MTDYRVPNWLPGWAHPRFPLVANELRKMTMLDYRIAMTSRFMVRLIGLLNPILLLVSLVLLFSQDGVFGFLVYAPLIAIAPAIVLMSEIFYFRLWTNARLMATGAIAAEVEHGTWDIIRSVPFPRHQLVFSKFAALLWMARPTLLQILTSRLVMTVFIGLLRYNLNNVRLTVADAIPLAGLGLIIVLMPLLELLVTMSGGLLISSYTANARQANLWTLIGQGLYRFLTALLFFAAYYETTDFSVLRFFPLLILPHWELFLLWMWQPVPLAEADRVGTFAIALSIAYFVLPIIVSGVSLWLTLRRVENV